MDDMTNAFAIYGSPDPQPQENPYSLFQSFSGSRLTNAGPTTNTDQTAYGNNDPTFYTDQLANLNNQAPPSFYQPIDAGYGAGVSPVPSQFTPSYYLRIFNRAVRPLRVAQGAFLATGMPVFNAPRSIDDSSVFEFPQATAGMKFPILIELSQSTLFYKTVVCPTGQNQFVIYIPFESELSDSKLPCAKVGGNLVYAESMQDLQIATAYLSQFSEGAPSAAPPPSPKVASVTVTAEAVVTPRPPAPAPAPAPAPRPQIRRVAAPQPKPVQTKKRALGGFGSALMLIGGALAAHYMDGTGD
jgi:hypothetical protein